MHGLLLSAISTLTAATLFACEAQPVTLSGTVVDEFDDGLTPEAELEAAEPKLEVAELEPVTRPHVEPEPRPALLVGEPFGGALVLDQDGNPLSPSTWMATQATKLVHADGHVWQCGGGHVEARRLEDGRLVANYQGCRGVAAAKGRVFVLAAGDTGETRALRVCEPSGELVHSVPIPGDPELLEAGGAVYVVRSDWGQNVRTIQQFDRDGQELQQFTLPINQTTTIVWRGQLALRVPGRVTTLAGEIIAERPDHHALFAGEGVEVWYHWTTETGYRIVFVREGVEPVTVPGLPGDVVQAEGFTYAIIYRAGASRIVRLEDMADLGPAAALAAMVPEPLRHHAPR